jgi:8-oxo-dGTP diphosphatase
MRDNPTLATHLLLAREGRVLLIRRAGTGWMDGHWSVPAGHVEAAESAAGATLREASEEIDVTISPDALTLVHTMHRRSDAARMDLFFTAATWAGEPVNREPDKCDGLVWADPAALPSPMVPYVAQAIACWRDGLPYSEHGWAR